MNSGNIRSGSKIRFFFEGTKMPISNRTLLKFGIEKLFRKEGKSLDSLNYIFCTDGRLLEINRTYLRHNYFTDIISFDISEGKKIKGEIYISLERVRENASQFRVPYSEEVKRVMVHGALHLCGYKDKLKGDIRQMREKEAYYLNWL